MMMYGKTDRAVEETDRQERGSRGMISFKCEHLL
jgi:hypothetical protein